MIATFVGSVLLRCFMGSVDKSNVLLLGIIVALSAILFAPVRPLMDSAVLATLEDKSMYGKSRLFGQIGFGLGSFMVGPLLKDAYIKWMFLVQAVLALPTALLMSTMPAMASTARSTCQVEQKRQTHLQTQELYRLLRDPVVLLFFAAVFLMGLSSGIIENFAFVRVSEVSRGSTAAMSWSRLLSALAGGPMFWLSGRIIKAIGTRAVMVLTLLTYVVRFAMYASITQALHAIPAEILRGVSFALFWSTATTYVYEKSPQGLSATMVSNVVYVCLYVFALHVYRCDVCMYCLILSITPFIDNNWQYTDNLYITYTFFTVGPTKRHLRWPGAVHRCLNWRRVSTYYGHFSCFLPLRHSRWSYFAGFSTNALRGDGSAEADGDVVGRFE